MVETKTQLIAELRRVAAEVDDLPGLISRESIYLEDGMHVDLEFLTAIMQLLRHYTEGAARVSASLKGLLGVDDDAPGTDLRKKSSGAKWPVEEVLRHCTYSGGVLRLPDVQLSQKTYAEVKRWITEAGGKWEGGKIQGFTFDFDGTRVAGLLMQGKRCNLKQDFQFFETPAGLADWLVSLAGVTEDDTVLEPSAGRGAIIKAVHRVAPGTLVDYYELMPENREHLAALGNVNYCGEDFTLGTPRLYTRIFANPPFAGNQDVRHVRAMYEALDSGGVVCAITSRHWMEAPEKVCVEFRAWLESVGAEVHDIPAGTFSESGTGVATAAIKITRR